MRFTRIDWSSDITYMMLLLFVVLFFVAMALERVSPKSKSKKSRRRRVDQTTPNGRGELID